MEEIIFEQNSQMLFFTYIVSGILGAIISIYFLKVYRVFSSSHIFGLVIGFALISFSDFFFSATIEAANSNEIFNVLHWLRLSFVSYGFVFVGLVYYFKKSTEKRVKLVIKNTLLSLVPIVLSLLIIDTNNSTLPDFQLYNEYFRIVNLIVLGYVICKVGLNPDFQNKPDLILLPLGFTTIFLAQCLRFLFTIDPMSLTLITSGILKTIGLGIIVFALSRKPKTSKIIKKLFSYGT